MATLACLLEVTASKPGNVNRSNDFADVGLIDFLASAVALGEAVEAFQAKPFGETVLEVARRTTKVTSSNTNLGINLLISLLSKVVHSGQSVVTKQISQYVDSIPDGEMEKMYRAIRLMNPGGMGEAQENDIAGDCSASVREVMVAASERDLVARQFVNGCAEVVEKVVPWLVDGKQKFGKWLLGIVWAHVNLMAEVPDSLIARKLGADAARQSQLRAEKAIAASLESEEAFWREVSELDFWLRSDGNRRNPGTTADLITAGIFVGIVTGKITQPFD